MADDELPPPQTNHTAEAAAPSEQRPPFLEWPLFKKFIFQRSYLVFGLIMFVSAAVITYIFLGAYLRDVVPQTSAISPDMLRSTMLGFIATGGLFYSVAVVFFVSWLGVVMFKDHFSGKFVLENFRPPKKISVHVISMIIIGVIITEMWSVVCGGLGAELAFVVLRSSFGSQGLHSTPVILLLCTLVSFWFLVLAVAVGGILAQYLKVWQAWLAGTLINLALLVGIVWLVSFSPWASSLQKLLAGNGGTKIMDGVRILLGIAAVVILNKIALGRVKQARSSEEN